MYRFNDYSLSLLAEYVIDKRNEGYDVNDVMFKFCTNPELIDVITLVKWNVYASIAAMHEWIDDILKIEFRKDDKQYYYNDTLINHMIRMYAYCLTERGDLPYTLIYNIPPMIMLNTEFEYIVWTDTYAAFTREFYTISFIKGNPMRGYFLQSNVFKDLMRLADENGWDFDESIFRD